MKIAVLFAISISVLAQTPETPKTARIEGVVISSTGGPVARATLQLTSPAMVVNGTQTPRAAYSATTDEAGKFAIENIDPRKEFQLLARRAGFLDGRYGARAASSAGVSFALEAGASLKGISISLTPQSVVSGKITNGTGDPVQNVNVAVIRRGYESGIRQLVPANDTTTNDQGEYRIAGLRPGRYYLMAGWSGLNEVAGAIPTLYPNATDTQGAAPLDIGAGQELRNFDIRLRQGKAFAIRGRVIGVRGEPLAGVTVLAILKTTERLLTIRNQANSRPDGSFDIRGLSSGRYMLQAISRQTGTTRTLARMDVNVVDGDLTDVVFAAPGGVTITGTIRIEDGDIKSLINAAETSPGRQPTLIASGNSVAVSVPPRIRLMLIEDASNPALSPAVGEVKEDGTFVIEGLLPGKFRLSAQTPPRETYVKSARFNGTDVIRNDIEVTSGSGGKLEILLSNKPADIKGTVMSQKDESVGAILVSLWTRDPEPGNGPNGIRITRADQSGGFQYEGLHPGVYYAAAWEDIDPQLAQVRDFLDLLSGDATKVELAEGEHSSPQVKIIPIAKIKAAEEKLP